MPVYRITTEASALIQALNAAGKSSRDIAAELKDQQGIELDQRSISRYLARIGGKRQKRKPKKATKSRSKPIAVPVPQAAADGEPLNEIKVIEARAREFQTILDQQKLPLRDRIAASKELRDCFSQIRDARGGANGPGDGKAAQDAAWVVQKLRRLVKNAPTETTPAAVSNGEESGAAHGS